MRAFPPSYAISQPTKDTLASFRLSFRPPWYNSPRNILKISLRSSALGSTIHDQLTLLAPIPHPRHPLLAPLRPRQWRLVQLRLVPNLWLEFVLLAQVRHGTTVEECVSGLFQVFGTFLPAGEPPADWVEGVAIMVAVPDRGKSRVTRYIWISCHAQILQVVGWLNDWQKERQFKVLNEKEERRVKVILNVVEHLIDVKECWFLSFFL